MDFLDIQSKIEKNWEKLPLENKFEYLHLRLYQLLNAAVNLYVLDKKYKLMLSFFKDLKNTKVDPFYTKELNKLSFLYKKINNHKIIAKRDLTLFRDYLSFLLDFHKYLLEDMLEFGIKTSVYTTKAREYKENLYSQNKLIYVQQFYRDIKEIVGIKEAFIQGSLSTLDYTKFSDFDTFIILDKTVEKDIDLFIDTILKMFISSVYFYKFDPYQHHRYFVCLESDISIYNQSFLPTKVLDYATVLKGNQHINFSIYNSKFSHIVFISNIINYFFQHKKKNFKEISNLWNFKYFLATIFFLPVLYLEVKGIYVYKKDSFQLIKDYLPKNLQDYLDFCSSLRESWDFNLTLTERLYRIIFLDIQKNPILYENLMKKNSQKINKKKIQDILKNSVYFADFFRNETINICKKEYQYLC